VTAVPPSHDALAAELHRAVVTADPVPGAWRAAARACFAWTAVDATPALMVYDSLAARGDRGGDRRVGVAPAPRELRFAAGTLTVEVDLDTGADKLRLVGRLTPARATAVVAFWPEGAAEARSDEAGVFRLDELPRRPLALHVRDAPAVKTGWIVA
jgi:hypothetical protein